MKKIIPVVIVLALAGAAVGIYLSHERESQEEGKVISLSGNIEVIEVPLSFRIAGWVQERRVDEGDKVQANQIVAMLDRKELDQQVRLSQAEAKGAQAALDELQAGSRPEEIAQALAARQRAQANLSELQAGSRPQEIAAAEAAVRQAKADADFRQKDFDRVNDLYEKKVATLQERDVADSANKAARAALEQAQERLRMVQEGPRKEQIEAAQRALEEASQHYDLVKKGPRIETIAQAAAKADQAKASLDIAKTKLEYTVLRSPIRGVVLSKNVEAGEYVSAGTPIVTAADILHVYLRAYINDTDLAKVKLGQAVRIRNDTYPDKEYVGKVAFIASQAEFTPKNVQTRKERVKLVYRVKIDIDNPQMELKPGMPADAQIELK